MHWLGKYHSQTITQELLLTLASVQRHDTVKKRKPLPVAPHPAGTRGVGDVRIVLPTDDRAFHGLPHVYRPSGHPAALLGAGGFEPQAVSVFDPGRQTLTQVLAPRNALTPRVAPAAPADWASWRAT